MHRKGYLFIVLLLSIINSSVSCLLHTKALEQLVLQYKSKLVHTFLFKFVSNEDINWL